MRFVKTIFIAVTILAFMTTGVLAGGWHWLHAELDKPGMNSAPLIFTVQRGEGFSSVAHRLERGGILAKNRAIRLKARLAGIETAIKAGTYELPAQVSARSVLQRLVDGDVMQMRLVIPEGLTSAQILHRIETNDSLTGVLPEQTIAEGGLLPDTYFFDVGTPRSVVVEHLQQAQAGFLAREWPDRQAGLPFSTPYEAIILASMVEKESASNAERPLIAGLFMRRLARGMRMESDPTVIYGISGGEPLFNANGERRTLYRSEINRKTDWNTYQIDGLPKTPICNPGRAAIKAVLHPVQTDYVFFVSDGKGGHLFARTYDQHQRNVAAYRAYENREIARERRHRDDLDF